MTNEPGKFLPVYTSDNLPKPGEVAWWHRYVGGDLQLIGRHIVTADGTFPDYDVPRDPEGQP